VKLLILGAAGLTGRELVAQALAQGHEVTAFVRRPEKLTVQHDRLEIVRGDVTDYTSVERAVEGKDGVLRALGSSTPVRRDPALVEGVRNVVRAMERMGVRRFVYLSFLGVREGRDRLSLLGRYVVAPLVMRNPAADHEVKEGIIKQSRLDWTIVRPPRLTKGRRTGVYRSGERVAAESMIPTLSRADLAEFMIRQLTDDAYSRKAPAVMY
jgi:putative NADH-flavin reductase